MHRETRSNDVNGRVCLANATVIIDQMSATEVRIRKAFVIPQDDVRFSEEIPIVLSDRDAFLGLLDHPPHPNPALRKLIAGKTRKHV